MNLNRNVWLAIIGVIAILLIVLLFKENPSDSLNQPPASVIEYFQAKTELKVIDIEGHVPQEGITGFLLIKAFPGILPSDFIGVKTKHGNYLVEGDKLQFMGNAPSDAAAITTEGMTILLQNITERLSLPSSNVDQIDELLSKIQ